MEEMGESRMTKSTKIEAALYSLGLQSAKPVRKSADTAWVLALLCALLCLVMLVALISMGQAGDMQQTAVDIETAKPYFWEIMAFCSILGCSRITQWLKQRRWWPEWMCTWRSSERGVHYKQINKGYLMTFFHITSYAAVLYCLMQRYDNLEQVAVVTLIINSMLFVVIEGGLKLIEQRNPEFAKIVSTGLYTSADDEEKTKLKKAAEVAATLILGGGVDKREDPTVPK